MQPVLEQRLGGSWIPPGVHAATMSATVLPGGKVVVEQVPGERWTPEDDRDLRSKFPAYAHGRIKGHAITGQYIDALYGRLMASETGAAYKDFLRSKGNGHARPGELEVIATVSDGVIDKRPGIVAATYPGLPKANLVLNGDVITQYCVAQAAKYGLSCDDVLEGVLLHELNHYFGQTINEQNQHELLVELNNDTDLVHFFMGRANAVTNAAEQRKYVTLAQMFADRYAGAYKKQLMSYIAAHMPRSTNQPVQAAAHGKSRAAPSSAILVPERAAQAVISITSALPPLHSSPLPSLAGGLLDEEALAAYTTIADEAWARYIKRTRFGYTVADLPSLGTLPLDSLFGGMNGRLSREPCPEGCAPPQGLRRQDDLRED